VTRDELAAYITEHFDGRLVPLETGKYDLLFQVNPEELLDVAQTLKDDANLQFDYLCNLLGVDTREHYEVIYNNKNQNPMNFIFD